MLGVAAEVVSRLALVYVTIWIASCRSGKVVGRCDGGFLLSAVVTVGQWRGNESERRDTSVRQSVIAVTSGNTPRTSEVSNSSSGEAYQSWCNMASKATDSRGCPAWS